MSTGCPFGSCYGCLTRGNLLVAGSTPSDLAVDADGFSRPGGAQAPRVEIHQLTLPALEFSVGALLAQRRPVGTSPDLCAYRFRSPGRRATQYRPDAYRGSSTSRRICRSCIVLAASSILGPRRRRRSPRSSPGGPGSSSGPCPRQPRGHGNVAVGDHAGQAVVIATDRQWADFQVAILPPLLEVWSRAGRIRGSGS